MQPIVHHWGSKCHSSACWGQVHSCLVLVNVFVICPEDIHNCVADTHVTQHDVMKANARGMWECFCDTLQGQIIQSGYFLSVGAWMPLCVHYYLDVQLLVREPVGILMN